MRTIYKSLIALLFVLILLAAPSCTDLTEMNVNPNTLDPKSISTRFVLSKVISTSVMHNTNMVFGYGVDQAVTMEAMQYLQRDYLEAEVTNTFLWFNQAWGTNGNGFSSILSDNEYLAKRAIGETDETFYTAVSLIMKSYWSAYMTSAWGDIPYSQAMKAEDGILKPVYDEQKLVFKGVLGDLEKANELLAGATVTTLVASADPLYAGNVMKWRQFANSLQLRYLLRLSEKAADMQGVGVDVKAKFSEIVGNNSKYPIITASADNAEVKFPGGTPAASFPGGPLNMTNRNNFYRRKPAATTIDFLKSHKDPRLTRWIRPVDVQLVVRSTGTDEGLIVKEADGKVKRYLKNYTAGIDTSLYVGLPPAHPTPSSYNKNDAAILSKIKEVAPAIYVDAAANPFVSYLADSYAKDSDPLVKSIFITASEVNFILAEAAVRTWISGSALDFYKKGITESLVQYGITDGAQMVYNPVNHKTEAFSLSTFLTQAEAEYASAANKLEPILTQAWVAGWFTTDTWFSWRKTGYPDLGKNLISASKGDKIPVRYGYGDPEKLRNGENTSAAIQRLKPATDDQWSKMWLIDGTGKPW